MANKPTAQSHFGKKIVIDSYKFDSQKEAQFYTDYLRGKGLDFEVHPRFVLQESFERAGLMFRQLVYTPDFLVRDDQGIQHIFDIKNGFNAYGIDTAAQLRFKLLTLKTGVPVEVVVMRKGYFWSKIMGTTKPTEQKKRFRANYKPEFERESLWLV